MSDEERCPSVRQPGGTKGGHLTNIGKLQEMDDAGIDNGRQEEECSMTRQPGGAKGRHQTLRQNVASTDTQERG